MKPRATYRLQLHPGFGFADAIAIVPYLAELGISHLYLSPVLQAAPGSTHGYDVVDPEHVSVELGGEAGFAALVQAVHSAGMAILLDIVPNHMSIAGRANRWWLDVLENGPSSHYAHFFDVDWHVGDDRVVLPILGERYGRALANGHLGIVRDGAGTFEIRAGDQRLPMAPRALGAIVRRAGERCGDAELAFVGDALAELPSPQAREREARHRRHRDKAVLAHRLVELAARPELARALDAEVTAINADVAELDALLEAQNYRIASWRVAASQLSYRRFFDIQTLVGVRDEDPDVFAACHARILSWLADRSIDGVRVDHVDGLRDPVEYLERLRPHAPWLVVEKILAPGESLRLPCDGTTGYELIELVDRLWLDPAGEAPLTALFEELTGQPWAPAAASRAARLDVLGDALHGELARLTELARRACAASPSCRDYTREEIQDALAAILAGYPVYRTYLRDREIAEIDRERIAIAVDAAAAPERDPDLLAFLEAALAIELTNADAVELARNMQQVTGAVVAKGDEDTLLYRQVRLIARCEVGGNLAAFAAEAADVHARLAAWPSRSLLASSTHDTKRGEDVRARLAVLSELPDEWRDAVLHWQARAHRYWGDITPDPVLAYVMWQTLVGAWPLPADRAQQYMHKAMREARLRTSWRNPDPAFEAAAAAWLDAIYQDRELVADIERFVARIAPHGDRNSLAQLVVKLAAPGVPDIYQGCELRDDSLVDPDNRRPIDFAERKGRLRAPPRDDLGGRKLDTIRRVLELRRRDPARFDAPYRGLAATGHHAHRVFAFARGDELVAVVPRLGVAADGWADTTLELPPGTWIDVLSDLRHAGGSQRVAELWRRGPVALLVRERAQ